MAGTKAGGLKAVIKIKAYDPLFYKKIGFKGGKASKGGPFQDREYAAEMGRRGGSASKRKKRIITP